jgi:hypothetical protein
VADDDVSVRFGANISGAVQGIDDVGHKLKDLDGPVREVIETFGQLRKTFVEAFAVREIAEFVTHIADLGEQAVRNASMLGMSVESVQKLGFAAKMTGGDAEGMATSLMRLERNMAEAQSGSGKAFEAFQSLGISLDDLKAKSPEQVLGMIADAFKGAEDGAAKTAIAMDLMGRAGAQMIPILDQGSEGLSRMGQVAEQTGSVLTTLEAEGLETTAREITTLKASVEGVGISLMEVFKPAIDALITGLTTLVQTLRAVVEMIRVLVDLIEGGIAIAIAGVIAKFEEFGITASNAIGNIKTGFVTLGTVIDDVIHGHFDKAADDWVEGTNRIRQANADTAAQIAKIGQAYDSLVTKIAKAIAAALTFGSAGGEGGGKNQLHAPTSGRTAKETGDNGHARAEMEIEQLRFQQKVQDMNAEFNLQQITEAQKIALLTQAANEQYTIDQKALDDALLTDQQYIDQSAILYQKHTLEISKLNEQLSAAQKKQYEQELQPWKQLMGDMGGAFDTMVNGILAGTQTFKGAMSRAFDDLAIKFAEVMSKMIAEYAAFAATGGKGILGFGTMNPFAALGGAGAAAGGGAANSATQALTAAITGNTASTVTNTGGILQEVESGLQWIAQTLGLTTTTVAQTTATTAAATASTANATATTGLIPTITANIAALTANTTALFASKAIPSFDVGTWSAPGGLSMLHPGEIVLPPSISAGVRAGTTSIGGVSGGNGGGQFNITIQAIDTQTGAQFLKNNMSLIAAGMSAQMRNFNPNLRPN